MAIPCDPASLARAAACYCFPRGMASGVQVYLACQWANGTPAPPPVVSDVIISNGVGGFCKLVINVGGNIGAEPDPGPASPAVILADGVGGFFQIVADADCNRGTISVAGPATAVPVLVDANSVSWSLVVAPDGSLGATS